MKRIVMAILVLAATACGKKEAVPSPSVSQPGAPQATQPGVTASPAMPPPSTVAPATAPEAQPPATTAPAPAPAQSSSGSSGSSGTSEGAMASGPGEYTVTEGDTLSSIARQHKLNSRDLANWNNIQDPNRIHKGQKLRLNAP